MGTFPVRRGLAVLTSCCNPDAIRQGVCSVEKWIHMQSPRIRKCTSCPAEEEETRLKLLSHPCAGATLRGVNRN